MRTPLLHSQPHATPLAVLDTNVVMDWLVFQDPSCQALSRAIESGDIRWLASEPTRAELAHVLGRGVAADRIADERAVWAHWDRFAWMAPTPSPAAASTRLRCTDTDDQKFIDLALASGARWLLSRDRAVLKLAKRAAGFGLTVLTPQRWTLGAAISPPFAERA